MIQYRRSMPTPTDRRVTATWLLTDHMTSRGKKNNRGSHTCQTYLYRIILHLISLQTLSCLDLRMRGGRRSSVIRGAIRLVLAPGHGRTLGVATPMELPGASHRRRYCSHLRSLLPRIRGEPRCAG